MQRIAGMPSNHSVTRQPERCTIPSSNAPAPGSGPAAAPSTCADKPFTENENKKYAAANVLRRNASSDQSPERLPDSVKANKRERNRRHSEVNPRPIALSVVRRPEKLDCDPDTDGTAQS